MSEQKYCEATKLVRGGYSYYGHRCVNKAKYERAGKWYCGIHDPVRRQAKRDAESAEREKERQGKNFDAFMDYLNNKGVQTRKLKLADEMVEMLRLIHDEFEAQSEIYPDDRIAHLPGKTFGQKVASILAKIDGEKS